MTGEPETLYKLMVLYMLDKVSYPLTNSQLSKFFLDQNYTSYFTLQSVLNELVESGLISSRQVGSSTHYFITDDGVQALSFFVSDITKAAASDMDAYLEENKFSLRSESMVTADYYANADNEYIVRCQAREGRSTLLAIDISVPDKGAAEDICANWRNMSQQIYSYLIRTLIK